MFLSVAAQFVPIYFGFILDISTAIKSLFYFPPSGLACWILGSVYTTKLNNLSIFLSY